VAPIDDTTVESNESVIVAVAAGGYTIGSPSSATVTVVSNDLAPDFTIYSFSAPDIASAGQSIIVTDTTRNQGLGQGAASATSFYLSANFLWDATDTLLTTRAVPALGPGGTNTANTTLTLPAEMEAAVYYVIAKADGPGVLMEASELNNIRAESISIGADLVVSAMTVPVNGGAGGQITVPNTVKNQGTGTSAPSTARLYLSVNFMFDGTDQMLAARPVPALNPGESNAGTTNVTIPFNWPTGTYYVLAVADADNEVPETSNTNNTRSGSIRIGADLTVTSLNVPTRAAVGASFSITDTTSNAGAGAASGSSRTSLYLSTNTTWEASDIALGVPRDIPALGAGAVSTGTTPITLPASAGPGRWYVIARADDLSQITETIESNNLRMTAVDIGPDLTLTSISAANSVAAGGSLTVTDTVLNYGIQTAPASANRYYLSLNPTLDASDIPLAGQRDVPALAANGSNNGSITLQIPPGLSGTYCLFAVADGNGVISEASETNNARWRLLTITP
jgi:trimeric autotransporter adhesin